MPKSPDRPHFLASSLEDVFAIYLSRELGDTERIGWYARLTHRYPLCLLLNALRRARKQAGHDRIQPETFHAALRRLLVDGGPL